MTRNAFWGLCIGICMASTQSVAQKIENTNIQTDNQKNYTPSHINEITNGESLYTVRSDTSLHNIRTIQANSNPEVLDKLTAELKPAIKGSMHSSMPQRVLSPIVQHPSVIFTP